MNSCFNCEWGHSVRDCKLPKEKEDICPMFNLKDHDCIKEIKEELKDDQRNGNCKIGIKRFSE